MRWLTRWLGDRSRTVRPSRPPVQLGAEELEARWNPSTTSTNWSGYAVPTAAGAATAVSGEWTVPTVTGSGTSYSAVWVGIDGYSSDSVEQTGIEADVVNGVAEYSAWYEMYPSNPVTLSLAIHPGDTITASVTYSTTTDEFTLTITDLSDPSGSNNFTTTQSAPGAQRSSAEWIVEAPSSGNSVLPLANFGSVTFTNASATINGTTGAINNSAWASSVESINMVSNKGTTEDTTSALNSAGTGFTVTYGSGTTTPTPPPTSPAPPPVAPPPPPAASPPPPPATGSIATTTSLGATSDPYTRLPTVVLTATVSPTVPNGGTVDLLYDGSVISQARVRDIGGVDEVSWIVSFTAVGNYTFSAEYLGSGAYAASTSSALTISVIANSPSSHNFWDSLVATWPQSPPPTPSSSSTSHQRGGWWW
jgi:hypothetical protein